MKKKMLALLLTVAMVVSFAGCGTKANNTPVGEATTDTAATDDAAATTATDDANNTSSGDSASGYELALVTDLGTIDDKSFNQGAWEGLTKYAEEKGISYKYYQPAEGTDAAYLETIGLAVEGGAKLVVCPGYLFEYPVYEAQTQYPDVKFILLDGEPHTADYATYKTEANVAPILYSEQQAGFLAGYAAVKDGYTKLGFMGGMAVPAVIRYGYGFIQGADYAAQELGIKAVDIQYHYTGAFVASPEAQAMAAAWYQNGTEVIFGCGGAVGNSVMAAAEAANAKVIGVDVDQSSESASVITSAMKMLSNSVYDEVTAYYDNKFTGGKTTIFDASNNGIGLPMETSKFNKFTQADYDAIFAKLVSGEVVPAKDDAAESAEKVPVKVVKVTEVTE